MTIKQQYHDYANKYPERIPKTIRQLLDRELTYENKYDYQEKLVNSCIGYIEHYCKLVDGEKAGEPLKLTLIQKYIISHIFGWWGNYEVEQFNTNGEYIGVVTEYQRVTRECLIMVASGFGKTTFVSALNVLIMTVDDLFKDPKIFIGSNAYRQSKLAYDTTRKMIENVPKFKKKFRITSHNGEINDPATGGQLRAMSSKLDNHEGIIPAVIILDEIHAMKTGDYANNLKKSTKRTDVLTFEITTQGTVRGGYLDDKLEYMRKILKGETESIVTDRIAPFIFEQESVEEVLKAYEDKNIDVLFKSNPNIGIAQTPNSLFNKIGEILDDPSKKSTTLSKNFNLPQNPESVFYTPNECKTLSFDEKLFINKHVFVGLDMAYTSSPNNDLTALTFMFKHPITKKTYHKDYAFIPKYYLDQNQEKHDMIKEKSKIDQIPYQQLVDKGDVVVVDETYDNLGNQITDGCRITEEYVINFVQMFLNANNCTILAFGLDPAKANKIKGHFNQLANNVLFCVDYKASSREWTTPIILDNRERRRQNLVYCNNKLTEMHFANTIAKYDNGDNILFINDQYKRKDLVISHMASENAFDMWALKRKMTRDNGDIYFNIEDYSRYYENLDLTEYEEKQ